VTTHSIIFQVHILKPPFVPAKCRASWADYVLLAKTRLADLKVGFFLLVNIHVIHFLWVAAV
jgi:hypothetical protein